MQHHAFPRKPLAIALLGAALGLQTGLIQPLTTAGQARAEEQQRNYVIAAGPLGAVLSRFASDAGVVLSFDARLTQDKRSPGLQGSYSIEEGFARLLRGNQLQVLRSSNGDYVLLPRGGEGAVELGATSVNAAGLGTTTEGTRSYATAGVTIGKSTQSLRETPQSVTVMTRQLMDDKNLNSLDKVMSKTPGITFSQRNYGAHVFQSRGFVLGEESYLMDGVPGQAYTVTGWLPPDMAVYDRVEVLRGASGLLVGAGNPGGAVNLVRKRPTAEPRFSVTARAGSWDNYRGDLDGSGKLNDSGTLRGRFVAAYEDRHSYLDQYESRTPLLYGVIEADLSDDTTVTASLRHQTGDINGYSIFGLPRYSNGNSLDLPRSTALVQDWNSHNSKMDEVFVELDHRFNDNWSSTTSVTHSLGTVDQAMAFARGSINPATNSGSAFRGIEFRRVGIDSNGVDSHVDGSFEAFGLTHQITVGANWSRQRIKDRAADIYLDPWIPVDVFDPDHHAIAKPERPDWISNNKLDDERYGLYANARLKLAEPLTLVLGGRVSWYDYAFKYKLDDAPDYDSKETGQVTPFAGLIYDFSQDWSWYASYADIFMPQSNYVDYTGAPLKPAVGTNYETGIKGELFDKALNLSVALFYIKQEDAFYFDPDEDHICRQNANSSCWLSGVVKRSKGFDVEASGELLPGLQVFGGYTYNLTASSGSEALSTETPKHLAKLSTRYTLPGEWKQVTVGAGVQAQSGYVNKLDDGTHYGAAGRAIWDARIAYALDEHWTVSLVGENLADRKYYVAADGLDRVNLYGEPRNYMLSLRGEF
ncbi:TonB-dependent siderophore receptor [Pseudomonas sp. 148P]|uniref:TonB-dependent siderophore receptor n=1 Tax=Pseudomonas ulcerans TaxID=3115852 RepID=A0ABU7HUH5_9PSED|nr:MULTISPECIES: TonB-dependent siderophore receptor [unclassified Pseudomonas]MEE1924037.1 TonB-dependent siderophore receptor [Pseudomonas sp. 147P]MEE1935200.1 TonB-dependent siderophore receptor [Pseudomonas sp. 148P]